MNQNKVDNINKKPAEAAHEVFEAVHAVMHLFRAEQYRVLRDGPHPIAHMEGKLLGHVARRPDCTLGDLVAHFARDKGQLARLIKTLKDMGLLEAVVDPADRRSMRLRLTADGRATHLTLRRQSARLEKLAVSGIDADECSRLVGLLGRVKANLESATGNPLSTRSPEKRGFPPATAG